MTPSRSRHPRSGNRYVLLFLPLWLGWASSVHASQLERAVEKLFGKVTADAMAAQYGLVTDPTVIGWVERVGRDVAAASPRGGIEYRFQILDTDEVNAFAAPDGHIFVTAGLLQSVSSDDEFAAILAHEVAHVAQKHFTDILLPELAILAGLSTIKDPDFRDALIAARMSTVLLMLRWSRKHEAQADYEGMCYALKAGYDPDGLQQFLRRLADGKSRKSPGLGAIFDTHPDPQRRYERAKAHPTLAQDYGTLMAIGDALAARGRLSRAAARYEAAAALRPDDPEPRVRLGAVLQRAGHFDEAAAAYQRAIELDPACEAARDGLALLQSASRVPEGPPAEAATVAAIRARVEGFIAGLQRWSTSGDADMEAVGETLDALRRNRSTNELMEKTLVLRPKYEDIKWLHLLFEVQDLIVQSKRAEQRLSHVWGAAPAVQGEFGALHSKLAASATGPLSQAQADDLSRLAEDLAFSTDVAGSEVRAAAGQAAAGARKLHQGVSTLTPVLFDLNSPFDTQRRLQYSRWAVLEAGVARARHAIEEALVCANEASRGTATAAARAHRLHISLLGALATPAQQALFHELLAQRLQSDPAVIRHLRAEGLLLGDVATVLVTARASGKPVGEILLCKDADRIGQAKRQGVHMAALRAILRAAARDLEAEQGWRRTPM